MADLTSLRELYAWMRQENILYARTGELELRLEATPQPLTPSRLTGSDEQNERPSSAEHDDGETAPSDGPAPGSDLEFFEDLLHSSGGDPTPFIRALQGRKEAAA